MRLPKLKVPLVIRRTAYYPNMRRRISELWDYARLRGKKGSMKPPLYFYLVLTVGFFLYAGLEVEGNRLIAMYVANQWQTRVEFFVVPWLLFFIPIIVSVLASSLPKKKFLVLPLDINTVTFLLGTLTVTILHWGDLGGFIHFEGYYLFYVTIITWAENFMAIKVVGLDGLRQDISRKVYEIQGVNAAKVNRFLRSSRARDVGIGEPEITEGQVVYFSAEGENDLIVTAYENPEVPEAQRDDSCLIAVLGFERDGISIKAPSRDWFDCKCSTVLNWIQKLNDEDLTANMHAPLKLMPKQKDGSYVPLAVLRYSEADFRNFLRTPSPDRTNFVITFFFLTIMLYGGYWLFSIGVLDEVNFILVLFFAAATQVASIPAYRRR